MVVDFAFACASDLFFSKLSCWRRTERQRERNIDTEIPNTKKYRQTEVGRSRGKKRVIDSYTQRERWTNKNRDT